MPVVFERGFERIIERGILDPEEWTRIKRDVAFEEEKRILSAAPAANEDPQVGWDFHKDWRRERQLKMGEAIGSDFDYWNYVVDDAFQLFDNFTSSSLFRRDYKAESIAGWEKGVSIEKYREYGLAVWQNGVKVDRGAPLEGPRVDVGPTADFAAFMERWSYSQTSNRGVIAVFENIGIMNAIARRLQADYRGVHTIFVMPVQPKAPLAEPTPNRVKPVGVYPVIRIVPRHYSRSR